MTWLTRRRLCMLAAAAFIFGLIGFLPAQLFEDHINATLPTPWHLGVSGTIWDGSGVLQTAQAADALVVPLTWKFDPLALIRARLVWRIAPNSPSLSGSVKVGAGWQSAEFRDTTLTMDAEILRQMVPVLTLFAPSGKVLVSTTSDIGLTVDYGNDFRLNGEAQLQADNFGLRPYGPGPLGNYQLKFTARDTNVEYVISQSSGALKLEGGGSIQMTAPRQIAYAGFVTASPTLHEALLAQVKSIGQPGADGRVRIDWKARW